MSARCHVRNLVTGVEGDGLAGRHDADSVGIYGKRMPCEKS